ncbi:uncharacterized protein [Argopecten irradians]|uniref:uncharacterized protein n=1 Tax=Argopecten irradians TaxID=31199 RepID=UPI0037171BFA
MAFNGFGQGPGAPPGGMSGIPGMSGQQQGIGNLPPEYAGLANLSEEDRNAALEAMLGKEGLRQLQQQQIGQSSLPGGPAGYGNPGMGLGHGMNNLPPGMNGYGGEDMANSGNMGNMFGGGDFANSRSFAGLNRPGSANGLPGYPSSGAGGSMRAPPTGMGGGGMDFGSRTMGPSAGGGANFGGPGMRAMNGGDSGNMYGGGVGGNMYGGGVSGNMYGGGDVANMYSGGDGGNMYGGGDQNRQMFNTPQNFMGQGGLAAQYGGESQLPPAMSGNSGGNGAGNDQASSQDPAQQLIGYVRATAASCTDPIAQGMNTILILDTSRSMQGEGIQQAKAAIEDIITGIEEGAMDNGLEENMALIVFGKESKVVQHLTNDYTKLRDSLDTLHTEGPSTIADSLIMSLGMTDRGGHIDLGGHIAKSRIIILSDAQFTQNDPSSTFNDMVDPRYADQMANEVSQIAHKVTDASGLRLYFVPVGNATCNDVIVQAVVGATGGSTCPATDAKFLSKGYLHHVIAGSILTESQGRVPDRALIAMAARDKYQGVEDRDIDAVISLIDEDKNLQSQGQGRAQGQGQSQMQGQGQKQGMSLGLAQQLSQGQGLGPQQLGQGHGWGQGQGIRDDQMSGQRSGTDSRLYASQFPSTEFGAPPGSLPPGIFNGDPTAVHLNPKKIDPAEAMNPRRSQQDNMFPGLELFGKKLPKLPEPTKFCEIAGEKYPIYDISGPLPENFPPELIGGEGARRQEVDPELALRAKILEEMPVSPELEETRKRTRTLTEDILEEIKRDLAAGKDAPKPWESPCLQKFLLIRKDGTKIEVGSDGLAIGDDEEAVLRREEQIKRKKLWEEYKHACDTHPDLQHPDDDDDIGEITEERVEELLEDFGGGPSAVDNLPNMPRLGLKVKPGPDWMWRCNGVGIFETGEVIGIDKEDVGWIRVKWDKNAFEEDYRWGLDYEFDVEPVEGGMDAVIWPEGKERIIKTTQDIADEFGPKQVKERLRRLARAKKEREKAEAAATAARQGTQNKPKPTPVHQNVSSLNQQNSEHSQLPSQQTDQPSSLLPPRVPSVTSSAAVSTATTTITTAATADQTTPIGNSQSGTNIPTAAPSAAKSSESCFVWQYFNEQGDWKNYPPEIQKKLEETYQKRPEKGTVMITINEQHERVVFQCMEQRNTKKKKVKKVRRIEADAESLRELQEMWAK